MIYRSPTIDPKDAWSDAYARSSTGVYVPIEALRVKLYVEVVSAPKGKVSKGILPPAVVVMAPSDRTVLRLIAEHPCSELRSGKHRFVVQIYTKQLKGLPIQPSMHDLETWYEKTKKSGWETFFTTDDAQKLIDYLDGQGWLSGRSPKHDKILLSQLPGVDYTSHGFPFPDVFSGDSVVTLYEDSGGESHDTLILFTTLGILVLVVGPCEVERRAHIGSGHGHYGPHRFRLESYVGNQDVELYDEDPEANEYEALKLLDDVNNFVVLYEGDDARMAVDAFETFLSQKMDWRPSETTPEDYYAG